jgi:hypothetical protein
MDNVWQFLPLDIVKLILQYKCGQEKFEANRRQLIKAQCEQHCLIRDNTVVIRNSWPRSEFWNAQAFRIKWFHTVEDEKKGELYFRLYKQTYEYLAKSEHNLS